MRSKQEQLENRGYLAEGMEFDFWELSFEDRIELLQSKVPTNRTLGARLLINSKENETVEYLLNALRIEKKLYSKMEICNSLATFEKFSIKPLIGMLGQIGNNQYNEVPEKEFKKDSYPLPRDIVSRTLIRIGIKALPDLLKILDSTNRRQISETIDTIGYLCFYNYKPEVYEKLKDCYLKNGTDDLIKWKIIQAMSGFTKSKSFLKEQKRHLQNPRLIKKIERSIRLIQKRKEKN